jgi:hypothetical protein
VVVVGDVGGHPAPLRAGLAAVGVDVDDLPADTVVVQVGDLVDRGPDSTGALRLVQAVLDRQPAQWVQLLGNHESQYVPGGLSFWPERLSTEDAGRLRTWWEDGQLAVAAAIVVEGGREYLLSHAGLTVPAWQDLGEPATAAEAARLLNERPDWLLWRGGLTDVTGRGPGPLWADAGWDLYEPWLRHRGPVPFGQIHGHSSIVSYSRREWRCPGRVRLRAAVDWTQRHTRLRIGGHAFHGVDPKHGRGGAPAWRPLVLEDATLVAPVAFRTTAS